MWIVILIVVFIVLFALLSKSKPIENKIKIDIDVPNPERCQYKTMIDFIENTPNYKLEPVFKEYTKRKLILKPIYIEAFNQKMIKDTIDLPYFYSKIEINIDPILEEVYEIEKEKPISLKKWADENPEDEDKDRTGLTGEDFYRFKTNKVDSKYLKPQIDLEDKSHEFYGKKVVITGSFNDFPFRNELAHLLWSVGADIDASITKNVDIVVMGTDAGWKKLELIEKFNIKVINQDILLDYFPDYKPKFT